MKKRLGKNLQPGDVIHSGNPLYRYIVVQPEYEKDLAVVCIPGYYLLQEERVVSGKPDIEERKFYYVLTENEVTQWKKYVKTRAYKKACEAPCF